MASRKCGKWDDGPVVDDELCEYELKRRENIKINQEMMKALGLPLNEERENLKKKKGHNEQRERAGPRRSQRVTSNKRCVKWVESQSDSDSEWEPWMEASQKKGTSRASQSSTKLPDLTWEQRLTMLETVNREVEDKLNTRNGRKKTKKRTRIRRNTDTGPSQEMGDLFNSDLSDETEFEGFTVEDLNQDELCRERNEVEELAKLKESYISSLFPESLSDEEFLGFTKEEVLLTDAPGYLTRTMAGLQTAKTYEEHELSDEDEYLFCDDCNSLYHGNCPIHGPLLELQTGVGYDHASLAYTLVPVPVQVTVKPSSIPGAGLGVFSTTTIEKGVRMGPYEGEKISKSDMGDLHNTAYAWEVHTSVGTSLVGGN